MAIKNDGTLWCWGKNNFGELGDGSIIDKLLPTQIGTDTNWQSIAGGGYHSVAIKTDGSLWGWGYNYFGQLGDGNSSMINMSPLHIGTETNWQSIATGNEFTLARKTNGTLWGCGDNYNGEFAGNTTPNSYVFLQIGTSTNWQIINAGFIHTVAIKSDETFWTSGSNFFGQLGIASAQENTYFLHQIACTALGNSDFSDESQISIYPNPAKEVLNIQNANNLAIDKIQITDMMGKKVMEQNGGESIYIQSLQQGVYIIQISAEGNTYTNKFVKQ